MRPSYAWVIACELPYYKWSPRLSMATMHGPPTIYERGQGLGFGYKWLAGLVSRVCMAGLDSRVCMAVSLVPRPFEEEEKGPGTHCLRMLRYPKNLRGSDTIVYFLVYLPFDLYSLWREWQA